MVSKPHHQNLEEAAECLLWSIRMFKLVALDLQQCALVGSDQIMIWKRFRTDTFACFQTFFQSLFILFSY